MNRFYIIFFSFLFILATQIPIVKYKIIQVFLEAKKEIILIKKDVKEKLTYFSNQSEKIKQLELQNRKLKNEVAQFESYYATCEKLKYFKLINKPHLKFVQVISYVSLPDFSKIYINYSKNITTPKGLVYDNLAAGIAVKNFGKYSLALLNSNPKTSYTVLVGKKEIPGIFYGKVDEVRFIKKYVKIKPGDLVVTSGFDGIFYRGALVGKVISVKQKKLYQVAKIKLFYNNLSPQFFYVVEKNDTIQINKGGKNERSGNRKHPKKNGAGT
jgi:rod shape-determining protein MreC